MIRIAGLWFQCHGSAGQSSSRWAATSKSVSDWLGGGQIEVPHTGRLCLLKNVLHPLLYHFRIR